MGAGGADEESRAGADWVLGESFSFKYSKIIFHLFHYSLTLPDGASTESHLYKGYFKDFFDAQTEKVQEKINYALYLVTIAERTPRKFFKHLAGTDGLYEVRIEYNSNIYRLFCCFDEGKLVVLFNGFQKKTQKTPKAEIDKALKIRTEYFQNKINEQNEKYNNF